MSMSTGGSTDRWTGNTSRTLGAIATSFAFCFLLLTFYIVIRYIFIQRLRRRAAAAPEPPELGLDPSVIASLPTFTYQKSSGGCSSCKQDEWSSTECAICLSVVDEGEVVRLLPNCSHVFHRECIDMWLDSNATCPVCRATADPNNPSISAALTAPPL